MFNFAEYEKRRRAEYKSKGICIQCGKSNEGGKAALCLDCYKKTQHRYNLRKLRFSFSDGCNRCGGILDDTKYVLCKKCREEKAKSKRKGYENKKHSDECMKCHNKRIPYSVYCFKHYLVMMGRNNGQKWDVLLKLYDSQNGKCFYSNRPLTIGLNASIDHKIPISKGGSNSIDNLVWAHNDINQAKRTLLPDEFIELCRSVVKYQEVNQLEKIYKQAEVGACKKEG